MKVLRLVNRSVIEDSGVDDSEGRLAMLFGSQCNCVKLMMDGDVVGSCVNWIVACCALNSGRLCHRVGDRRAEPSHIRTVCCPPRGPDLASERMSSCDRPFNIRYQRMKSEGSLSADHHSSLSDTSNISKLVPFLSDLSTWSKH